MSDRPTEIFRAANSQHAQMLRQMLEERGIKAYIVNESLQTAGGDLPLGWTAAPRILVAEEDAVKGRLIAEQFDAILRDGKAVEMEEFDVADADWTDWPLCPHCHQRREVLCNICGSRGSKFALADLVEENDRTQVLLHCDSCDDHFRPKFFRICHHCGHDFGSGIDPQPVQQELQLPENTRRTWIVVAGLIGFAAIIGAYLYWLVNSRAG
ncbi:MAG: DUF2007 domain-containing protein [Planctomycetales bacterium]|nr:DUF2007 domain-containing protein [Planctomycetales bacterium]